MLNDGLKALPEKTGELLALRGLVRLEMALSANDKVTAETPGMKEAFADADAAIKAGAKASGQYVAGRIAEEIGQLQQAIQLYQTSVEAFPEGHADLDRSRLALARVKLRAFEARPRSAGVFHLRLRVGWR